MSIRSKTYNLKELYEITAEDRRGIYEAAMRRSDQIVKGKELRELTKKNRERLDRLYAREVERDATCGVDYGDEERLKFIMQCFDGLCGFDQHEEAAEVAAERDHDEPDEQDQLDGFRRMVDKARAKQEE